MTKEGPHTSTPSHRSPSRVWGVLLVLGIVLLAANLRPVLTGLTPLIGQIKADTGISYGGAGLLMALSLLAMGVLSPIAPLLARRLGVRAAGEYARVRSGHPATLGGAVNGDVSGHRRLGAGIAIGNVLLPGLVKREFPERVGLMTSTYTAALAASATIAAGASFPVASQVDIGWRGSLALWAIPALWPPWLGSLRFGTLVARTPLPQLPRGLAARGTRRSPAR
jgi:CP family cyanate transporter-like MFS transporter